MCLYLTHVVCLYVIKVNYKLTNRQTQKKHAGGLQETMNKVQYSGFTLGPSNKFYRIAR